MERDTQLDRISEEEFEEFLRENPARIVDIMGRLCHKLRETTKGYLKICHALNDSVGTQVDKVAESTTYGFEQNETLKAIHDDVYAKASDEA